jgi:putative tryptophan/tyrosine transport system substrate-binding protein
MKRRHGLRLLGATAFAPLMARAQGKAEPKVGYVLLGPRQDTAARLETLRSGLRLAGAAFGQAEIVARTTEGDPGRIVPLVDEVMAAKPSVFVAAGPALLRAARQASGTIPIVAYDFETDPVAEHYAQSIARPGGAVTGVFLDVPEFVGKWIEFLRECLPQLARIALVGDPGAESPQADTLTRIAAGLGIATDRVEMRVRADLAGAVAAAKARDAEAAIFLSSPLVFVNAKELAELTLSHRLPAITMFAPFAKNGGLLSYGPDLVGALKQAGAMAGKLLAGASPATLPIERPTTFELIVNLKAAERLGVAVPPVLKARADEVVD